MPLPVSINMTAKEIHISEAFYIFNAFFDSEDLSFECTDDKYRHSFIF